MAAFVGCDLGVLGCGVVFALWGFCGRGRSAFRMGCYGYITGLTCADLGGMIRFMSNSLPKNSPHIPKLDESLTVVAISRDGAVFTKERGCHCPFACVAASEPCDFR